MENFQNTVEQAAIPAEQEPQQETVNDEVTATESQEQKPIEETSATEQQEGGSAAQEEPSAEEPFLVARYLKEDKPLSRTEAKNWVEKGMHYESIYNELDYIAAQSDTDVKSLVGSLRKRMEDGYRQSLIDRIGNDTDEEKAIVEDMMRVYREKQKEKYDKIVSERKSQTETNLSSRLADEYLELKKRIPTVPAFAELPDAVKKEAAEGMNLTTAFLLFKHSEESKIAAAQREAQAAQNASAGPMSSASDSKSSEEEQYLAGLWGR